MKKYITIIFLIIPTICYANPSTSISGLTIATPNTSISSNDYNTNQNTISNTFNAHTHTDITQVGTITTGIWAATAIGTSFVASGAGAITGEIRLWGGTSGNIPTGWLKCDGSAISRTTYSALFAITGTAFGVGDGLTTFNLPTITGTALYIIKT